MGRWLLVGAWGLGPFDSDTALDLFGDLAHRFAERDDDGDVVAGSVDVAAVTAELREVLGSAQTASSGDEIYAAAGLVAAALHPLLADRRENSGTRLFAHLEAGVAADLGLGSHCGYLALLPLEAALSLREQAVAAVQGLAANEGWLGRWFSGGVKELVVALEALLTSHSATPN